MEVKAGELATVMRCSEDVQFDDIAHRARSRLTACKNDSDTRVNLSLGLLQETSTGETFEPMMLWRRVGSGSAATTQFIPVLRAYITSDYKETEFVRAEIESDCIWSKNLDELESMTAWDLREHPSGEFTITSSYDS